MWGGHVFRLAGGRVVPRVRFAYPGYKSVLLGAGSMLLASP